MICNKCLTVCTCGKAYSDISYNDTVKILSILKSKVSQFGKDCNIKIDNVDLEFVDPTLMSSLEYIATVKSKCSKHFEEYMLQDPDMDIRSQYEKLKLSDNPYDVLIILEMMLYSPYLDKVMFFRIMSNVIDNMYKDGYITESIYKSFIQATCDTTEHEKFNIAQQLDRLTSNDNNLISKFMIRTLQTSTKLEMMNVIGNYIIFPCLLDKLHTDWKELFTDLYRNKDYNYPNISDLEALKKILISHFTL